MGLSQNDHLQCYTDINQAITSRERGAIILLFSLLVRLILVYRVQIWSDWGRSKGGPQNEQKTGGPALCRKTGAVWSFHPGEEKARWGLCHGTPVLKGQLQEDGGSPFTRSLRKRTRHNEYKLRWERFCLVIRKNFFLQREPSTTGISSPGMWQSPHHWRSQEVTGGGAGQCLLGFLFPLKVGPGDLLRFLPTWGCSLTQAGWSVERLVWGFSKEGEKGAWGASWGQPSQLRCGCSPFLAGLHLPPCRFLFLPNVDSSAL